MTYSTLIDQTKPPKKQAYGNKYSSRGGSKISRVAAGVTRPGHGRGAWDSFSR